MQTKLVAVVTLAAFLVGCSPSQSSVDIQGPVDTAIAQTMEIREQVDQFVAETVAAQQLHIFLSHCHWDHVQGLPFFEPLRGTGTQVNFRLPAHMLTQADRILQTQLDPLFFPIALQDLRARIVMEAAHEREEIDDMSIRSAAVEHPGGALAYRVCAGDDEGRSVVFAPDSEISFVPGCDSMPTERKASTPSLKT